MMVAPRKTIKEALNTDVDSACISVEEAYSQCAQGPLWGVSPMLYSKHRAELDDVGLTTDQVNVPVAKQQVLVENSTCLIGEETEDLETRRVVTACPTEQQRRCANCILSIASGAQMLSELINSRLMPLGSVYYD